MVTILNVSTTFSLLIDRYFKIKSELAEVKRRIRCEEISFDVEEKRKLEGSDSRMSLERVRNSSYITFYISCICRLL